MVLKTKVKEVTLMRSKKTMKKYFDYLNNIKDVKNEKPFSDIEDRAIKKFKYWIIVENNFPYDAIAEISHLLFTRREVAFNWKLLTKDEREELIEIKSEYLSKHYDTVFENLPSIQSAPGHFHLQLLKLKLVKTEEFFK